MGIIGLCIHSKSSRDSMEMQVAPLCQGCIPLFLYTRALHGQPPFQVPHREGLTAEALCWQASRECSVPRLNANLFAIYDQAQGIWLSPATKVKPTDRQLVFRIRFHMPRSPSNITSLEESVVAYLFAQYRHDYLHNRIPNISMEESLGLMVLDMVRYAYENHHSVERCLRDNLFKKFLPKSLSKELKVLDTWKLKKKIRKSLGEFDRVERDAHNYRMMFLISLMEENRSWGVEEFATATGQRFAVSAEARGVKLIEPANQAKLFKLDFEDIVKISMFASREAGSNNWVIHVKQREDAPKEFVVESKLMAESLISLIDGYCRLLIDHYHYLFQECAPPSLVQLINSRCHGPIPLSFAKKKIEAAGKEDGIYLIRQNPEDFSSYCLTARLDGKIKNYKINVDEDGCVGLPGQRTFPDVRALADYYHCTVNCACIEGPLIKAIPYQSRDECLQLRDLSALPELPRKPPPEPQIEWIQQDNISKRRRWKRLGGGAFTSVYRGEVRKRDRGWIQVAIKCPNKDASQQVQQKFSQSVDVMSSWNNQSIIKFIGIGAGFSLIMAYAPFGSMDEYLRSQEAMIGASHQVAIAVQLIDALEYLESRKIIHGSISAHNTLVVRGLPRVRVKLGDSMLSRYYHSLPMERKLKWVRWLPPELIRANAEPTLESDRWSFGLVLWQILAYGKIPFEDKSDNEVLQLYTQHKFPPLNLHSLEPVNILIKNCWHVVPSDRVTFKHLMMELNRIFMEIQQGDEAAAMQWEVLGDEEDGPEPILEDFSEGEQSGGSDEELMDISWQASGFAGLADIDLMTTYPGQSSNQADIYPSSGRLMKFSGIEKIAMGTLEIIGPPIGEGNFGFVYFGHWNRGPMNKLPVAIKEIKENRANEQELQQFEKEIAQLSSFNHKNIVKVLGVMEAGLGNPLRLVMEYLPLGALNKFLEQKKIGNKVVSLATMLTFAQQVAQGMAYLGERNVVHRDLAARNVLVASDASVNTEPEVKISDFGLARKYTTEGYYQTSGRDRQLPVFMYAIECIWGHGKFSSMSDVWSFGVLLWEMFSYGERPKYKNEAGENASIQEIETFLRKGKRLLKPAGCPQIIYTMMNDCWHLEKLEQRLGRILEDPTLASAS
ncbi:tyrosine-protein kinase JAK2-like [Acanthaster planci]|uniref:Tyrosine-protein kinase n=1 Tax=Acanthaster planci TaxID=133434 RepID=A0A8B7ZU53_ACAPL|nr:tyrosine-protein kinase JAK2-like [Acanthaster planci]